MNYKRAILDYIGVDGLTKGIVSGGTLKVLYFPHAGAVVAQSLIDASSYADDYQVPSGKTLKVIALLINFRIAGNGNYKIYQGDTADAETLLKNNVGITGVAGGLLHLPLIFDIASGKFIVGLPVGAITQQAMVVGYEVTN